MLVAPLGIVWFAAVVLATLDGRRAKVAWFAVAALAASWFGSVLLLIDVWRNGPSRMVAGGWEAGVGIVLEADTLGMTFAVLSMSVLLFAMTFEVLGGIRSRSFPALVLFLATGLTGLFLTGDVFNFYVFFELAMIAAYVMTAYGEDRRQLRAASIFAVVNLLGSVLFLIGIAALYHVTGRLDMSGIANRMPIVEQNPAILTGVLIFVAFGIKLGLFPFHFWLAAVYTGTRPAVAAILSGALANIGSYGLLRFGGELLPREIEQGRYALFILGGLSVLYGGLQAISRRSVAEVLAYSSIGQVGYILIALAIGDRIGYAAAILFAIVNSANKTLLFLSEYLRGRFVAAAFAVGAFSVAGIPPAAGFVGKAAIIRAGIADNRPSVSILVVVGGALSLIYMFQIFQRRYWEPRSDEAPRGTNVVSQRSLVWIIAMLLIVLGVWPEPLLAISEQAASMLPGRI